MQYAGLLNLLTFKLYFTLIKVHEIEKIVLQSVKKTGKTVKTLSATWMSYLGFSEVKNHFNFLAVA